MVDAPVACPSACDHFTTGFLRDALRELLKAHTFMLPCDFPVRLRRSTWSEARLVPTIQERNVDRATVLD